MIGRQAAERGGERASPGAHPMRLGAGRRAVALLTALFVAACAGQAMREPRTVVVRLETTKGDIEIAVDVDRAPLTSADFLRYVDRKLYDGATFFRAVRRDNDRTVPGVELLQARISDDSPGLPPIAHETTRDTGIAHVNGTVSVARAAPGTGTAATFFIVIGEQRALDYGGLRNPDGQGFAAFGRVVRGMEVVRTIHAMPTNGASDNGLMAGQVLSEPVVIRRARVTARDRP
jgi:peptidyl-prolyl cis-trans isomerase A (cyclophilin A)